MEEKRRKLETMPFDMTFETEGGNRESCHCTGWEVCDERGDWWNEYRDSKGNLYYGR